MPRVRIKNHTKAPQGFYQDPEVDGPDGVAVIVQPGETSGPLAFSEVQMGLLDAFGTGVTVFKDGDEPPAPARAEPAAPAATAENEADAFEAMTDDDLRAFLTDRGQKPHHKLGREKLLTMARGPADGAEPEPDASETEAV